jgi:hypothetical protein
MTLYVFLSWQYLIGSLLFLLGGLFDYRRAYLVMRQATSEQSAVSAGTGAGIDGY